MPAHHLRGTRVYFSAIAAITDSVTDSVTNLTSASRFMPSTPGARPLPWPPSNEFGEGAGAEVGDEVGSMEIEPDAAKSEAWHSFRFEASKRMSGRPSFFFLASRSEPCSSVMRSEEHTSELQS